MSIYGQSTYVNGVHSPLLNTLGDTGVIRTIFVDRYSTDEDGGLESQVARHMSLYPDDLDVVSYLELIDQGAFENVPKLSVGSVLQEGIPAWVSARDVHHEAKKTRPQISMVRFGDKLFVRVNMSAVKLDIRRADGSEDNAYTVLLVAFVKAFPNLKKVCWAHDINRVSRTGVNWSILLREHEEHGVRMSLGGKVYDLSEHGIQALLGLMGVISSEDDPVRRRRMLTGQINKWTSGVFALGPQFLPYGWDLPRRETGTVPSRAHPIPNLEAGKAMGQFFELFADGKPPREIIQRMAQLEADGQISRRAGNSVGMTFQNALESSSPLECAKLVNGMARRTNENGIPSPERPSETVLSEYLAGADPRLIFDIPQQLAIATMETFRTGIWLRALKNTIRQKNFRDLGNIPVSFGDDASKSYFIIPAPWPWPVDENTGELIERFGIPDDVLRRAAARVLRNLRPNNAGPRGGRTHVRAERRAFQNFNEWEIGDSTYIAWAAAGSRSGLVNTTIYRQSKTSPRPWSHIRNDRAHHPVATIRQSDLMSAVAQNLIVDIPESLLAKTQSLGSVQVRTTQSEREIQKDGLLARAERAAQEAKVYNLAAAGSRKIAAVTAEEEGLDQAETYMKEATEHSRKARDHEQKSIQLREQAEQQTDADSYSTNGDPIETNLSIVAYMAAGLTKSLERKRVTATVGTLCDKLFSNWTFEPYVGPAGESLVRYSVALELPVEGDSTVQVTLNGSVKNVYRPKGSKGNHQVSG